MPTLTLIGDVPAKKNLWRRGKSGRMFLDAAVKSQIDALTLQAQSQWGFHAAAPLVHPEIAVELHVSTRRRDQDGMYTTILDCLQAAGVIRNDNIAWNNGRKVLEPCKLVKPGQEMVKIEVMERGKGTES